MREFIAVNSETAAGSGMPNIELREALDCRWEFRQKRSQRWNEKI